MSQQPNLDPRYIASLPESTVIAGEHIYRTRIDEKNNIGYIMDEEGKWTNRWIYMEPYERNSDDDRNFDDDSNEISDDAAASDEFASGSPEADRTEEDLPETEDDTSVTDNQDITDDQKKRKSKRKKIAIISICAVLAIGISLAVQVQKKIDSIQRQEKNPSQTTQQTNTETEESVATTESSLPILLPDSVDDNEPVKYVITVTQDILPGTLLTGELLAKEEILSSEYRSAAVSTGLYLWDDINSISENMYSNTFIPAGCFITYENVALSYQPENPWQSGDSTVLLLDIPVTITSENIQSYCYGRTLSLKVTTSAQTNVAEGTEQTEPLAGEGIRQEDSVVEAMTVSTYSISGIKVIDLINDSGESLFCQYRMLADVPAVYVQRVLAAQYQDSALAQVHTPAWIRVTVTQDQMNVLSQIDWSKSEIELTASALAEGTDLQRATSNQIGAILPSMMQAIEHIQAEE